METTNAEVLERTRDFLEKEMQNLPRKSSEKQRRSYLSGCLETLHKFGAIDLETLEILLLEYGL